MDLAHKSVEDGHVLSKRTVLFLFWGGGVTFCFRCFGFYISSLFFFAKFFSSVVTLSKAADVTDEAHGA